MYALKWWMVSTRMFFDGGAEGAASSGSGDGGGSGSASPNPASAPSSDGAGSGSSAVPSGEGGGSASPAETPPSSPDSTPAAQPTSDEMDWSALGSLDDLDAIEVPQVPAPVTTPTAPQAAPAAPTPQPQPPKEPQAQTPAAAAPTTPAPQDQTPAVRLSASDPLGIATALEANRDASIAHLAQTRFALSPEDVAALEDNAAAFVPTMMARVHHEAQVSMMKFLAQAVPGMLQQFQTITQANTEAEDKFFAAHERLGLSKTNKDHRATAFRIAKLYRQANPGMPMDQLIAEVGPIVAHTLKLPVPSPVAAPGTPQPVAHRGAPTGFRPAVNGGGGAPPTPEPQSEWAGMGRDYDEG